MLMSPFVNRVVIHYELKQNVYLYAFGSGPEPGYAHGGFTKPA